MSSRTLSDCHPDVERMAKAALAACARDGIDVLVTCTFRSAQEQDLLYAQGRTAPGKIVTNAKAGQSSHNHRIGTRPASLALDVVPLRYGKPVWGLKGNGMDDDPADDDQDDLELWQRVRAHFEATGLRSASRWRSFPEWPHFEHENARAILTGAA